MPSHHLSSEVSTAAWLRGFWFLRGIGRGGHRNKTGRIGFQLSFFACLLAPRNLSSNLDLTLPPCTRSRPGFASGRHTLSSTSSLRHVWFGITQVDKAAT